VALVSLLVLALFATAVGINLRRGRSIPCACGPAPETIGGTTLLRLALLGGAAVLVAQLQPATGRLLPAGLSPGDAIDAVGLALAGYALLTLLHPAGLVLGAVRRQRAAAHAGARP
jgi:hypothetical protein